MQLLFGKNMINSFFERPLWQKTAFAFALGIGAGIVLGPTATRLKPLGDLYLNAVRMIVVPLVFFTVATSLTRLSQATKVMRLGVRTLLWFLITSALAVVVGLVIGYLINPGAGLGSLPLGELKPRTIPGMIEGESMVAAARATVGRVMEQELSGFESPTSTWSGARQLWWVDGRPGARLTTTLRGKFGARRYLGIELEVSQALALGPARRQTDVPNRIAHSLALLLTGQAE